MDGARERDQSIERLLRQSLKTPQHDGVTASCLDAETLAAWAEGGLSGETLESAQLHVADCSRCQDLAGTLSRINSTVPQLEPERASRRWLSWFVPLTAAAAALAIWVALPGNDAQNALVRQTPSLQSQLQDKVAERQAQEPQPPASPAPPIGGDPAPPSSNAPDAPLDRSTRQQPAIAPDAASKDVARNDEAKERFEAFAPPAAPPAAAPAPAAAAPAPAAAATAAPSAFAAESAVGRARSAARVAAAAAEIQSPDPAVRWRIFGSAVQRSANGGSTWETVSTGVSAELTAGAAPSTTVCWLVGRGGVVLLTTDGRTWRRVAFPEMTDLSAVFTVDASGHLASVSTVDGRTFVTTDGGVTWTSRISR